ncbi:MAG: coproporphyrinogen III oxidase family protein [Planctomycetota bacterium]|jgi:coproporphyrinogen III oxidase-like Fe-S oxidoreductase
MFIDNFIAKYSTSLAKRYLTFEDSSTIPLPKSDKSNSLLLYIHIPFCEQLCPYCSFFRIEYEPDLASNYFDALENEIKRYKMLGYNFDAVYIGGGTPTIMPNKLARIIDCIRNNWDIKQLSVETNPNHLKPEIIKILKNSGTNRLSIGVQTFNDEILESIQRLEKYGTGQEIKEKISSVVGIFDTINIDMIFNFPKQNQQMLSEDIHFIKNIQADQITYYPLIASESKKKELTEKCGTIDYKKEKELYKFLVRQLADNYNQESIWCFSKKKGLIDEYIVDHNEYIGIGAGAMGYFRGTLYFNTFSIRQYITMANQNIPTVTATRKFSHIERMRFHFLLKLLAGKLNIQDMKQKFGSLFKLALAPELLFFTANGAITFKNNSIQLTPRGRYYWVILMRSLFSVVGDYRQSQMSIHTLANENIYDS